MQKVIIAFDIGTTFSGVSYCILDPQSGLLPKIQGVNEWGKAFKWSLEFRLTVFSRFPGQPTQVDSKVPSHLLYLGTEVKHLGAEVEAFEQDGSEEAEEIRPYCKKIQWFKLLMRPESLPIPGDQDVDAVLPDGGVSVTEVYSAFLKYLYNYTKTYIKEGLILGDKILSDESRFRFVITHPNGWELPQQKRLRMAATLAGIISHENDSRLCLLTEGEAAIHFCMNSEDSKEALNSKTGILVIDAGGGTIDLSAYRQPSVDKGETPGLKEITKAQCLMQGSVFVNHRANSYLESRLKDSEYKKFIPTMMNLFEKTGKRMFELSTNLKETYIRFGGPGDSDSQVFSGRIGIPFIAMVGFFEPSIKAITKAVREMVSSCESTYPIRHIFMVGGFAGNRWLLHRLKQAFEPLGISITRPRGQLSKAVADGAVAYCIKSQVTARVAKETFGTKYYTLYDSKNAEHRKRYKTHHFVNKADKKIYIDNLFAPIVVEGTQVEATREFRASFFRKFKDFDDPTFQNPLQDEILCYQGKNIRDEMFRDTDPENYETIFTLQSTLDKKTLKWIQEQKGKYGRHWMQIDYDIIFYFGLTELKVQATLTRQGPGVWPSREEVLRFEPKVIYFDRDKDEGESGTGNSSKA